MASTTSDDAEMAKSTTKTDLAAIKVGVVQTKSPGAPLIALIACLTALAITGLALAAVAFSRTMPASVDALAPSPPATASIYSVVNPDPTLLVWDKTPMTNETVNGWLTVPLDPEKATSDKVRVRVTVQLAKVQPAADGIILGHCGGPGSKKECGIGLKGMQFGIPDTFDHFGIDQRGVGESLPPNWPAAFPQTDALKAITKVACLPTIRDAAALEMALTTSYYSQLTARSNPAFHTASGANYIDFVGTSVLAHDLDHLRKAMGQEKLSIYGISYGTEVGAVYSTLFPDKVARVVLSGAVPPSQSSEDFVTGSAQAATQTAYRVVELCAQQAVAGKPCPLADTLVATTPASQLFQAVIDRYRTTFDELLNLQVTWPGPNGSTITLHPYTVQGILPNLGRVSEWNGWLVGVEKIAARTEDMKEVAIKYYASYASTFPIICDQTAGPQTFILGSDLDRMDNQRVAHVMSQVTENYGAIGWIAAINWATYFSGPGVPRPAGPLGNPKVAALSTASLYDAQTYYQWTSQMHGAFPSGSILTWQGGGHGVYQKQGWYDPPAALACAEKIADYLTTGSVASIRPFPVCVTTCEPEVGVAPEASSCVKSWRRA